MSNFGQGVAAVAGAVVGFVVGGPTGAAYGFQIGLLAGSALFPTQLPGVTGPRLEDVEQTAADPGSPVPICYGNVAITGATIWLGPVVEESETEEVGGKGAPEQEVTTYSYRQSIAIGICEGPVTGITRIWENGKLVYDLRGQLEDETDETYAARVEASTEYADAFELYLGTEDQLPDPTIEADRGAGNVPGFRGLCYIVYPSRLLRDDQGRRHPMFRFEVSTTPAQIPVVAYTEPGVYTWNKPAGLASARVVAIGAGGGAASGGAVGGNGFPYSGGGGGGGELSELTFDADDLPDSVTVTVGDGGEGGDPVNSSNSTPADPNPGVDGGDSSFGTFVTANGGEGGGQTSGTGTPGGAGGTGGTGSVEAGGAGGSGDASNTTQNNDPGESTLRAGAGGAGGGTTRTTDTVLPTPAGGNTAVCNGGRGGTGLAQPNGGPGGPGGDGQSSDVYEGGAGGGGGGAASGNFPEAPGSAVGGKGGDGGRYGGGGGGGGSAQGRDTLATGGRGGRGGDGVVVVYQTFAGSTFSLADVVEDICHRAGLYDIDVEQLRSIPIDGYAVGRPMPARSALEPLRSFGYFDVVESDGVLRFKVRGGAAVLQLTAADLGARPAGEDGEPAITTRKLQDVELPRQVRVRYLDNGRDYEPGEQLSPVRLTTEAENDVEVDLPIVMTGERAARLAEVLWADAWRSRWIHAFVLEGRYLELEPADVLEVPVDGRYQRMRLVSVEDDGGTLRRCEAVRDDDGAYVSYAVAADPVRQPNAISILNATELLVLDLPALRDQDDDAGIYAAAYPTGTGTRWDGCVVYRSADGGGTFSPAGSIVTGAPAGRLATPLADGITSTFDEAATLTVDMDYGELEARTEAALLEGANTAAIGADGRWQLIQFRDVVQVTPTRYTLSGIIRGRRGTEHETYSSQSGDRFVLLSTGAVIRLALQAADIGAERVYRAVTIGASYASGTNQSHTARGVALRPFSPVDIALTDQDSGDVRITWTRRNRLGQELRDGVEIAMSEASELYAVDIFPRSDVTVPLRTLSTSSESATYTVAEIADDFGSPMATADTLAVAVYQVSAAVGRGIPGYFPAGLFANEILDPDISAEADRSSSVDYLEYVKADYPDSAVTDRTLEYRHRNPAAGYVVDSQLYGAANTVLRRFEDGETEAIGSAGALYVNALASDPDPRYFYISQLYGGTTLNGSGPGLVRRIDASLFSPGGILSGITAAASSAIGASGDPQSLVVIGDYVYASAPFAQAVYKLNRADLTVAAVLSTAWRPWSLAARGSELWAVERARPSPTLWRIDPDTGATLDSITLSDGFPIDLAIAGDYAYIVATDSAALAKYSLVSGLRQAFELDLSGDTFGSTRNYLTLDGVRLSVARDPVVYVIDTATDTQIAP